MTSFSEATERYHFVECTTLRNTFVEEYWEALLRSGRLRWRFPEVRNPTLKDVADLIGFPYARTFLAYDALFDRVAGETTVERLNGLSTMVHLSIHPSYYGDDAVEMARAGARFLFSNLTHPEGRNLTTLIGLIPESNRLAQRFTEKVGYERKTILTNAFILANNDNKLDNGILFQLTSESIHGW